MQKRNVQSPADALQYLTDCTLATVCDMAMKKSRSAHEYQRQKNIAQAGIDWLNAFHVDYDSRPFDANAEGGVEEWAAKYDVKQPVARP